jgi:phenylpropionate dioxygenase-like ring-hydroxylating dioxygenase large terminal subunit
MTLLVENMTQNEAAEWPFSLVREGMVHSAVYTSPEIFELEMERIFHRTWVFVGHESEIAEKGDFRARQVGRLPVIFVRGKDGIVRVLVNRCRHRGAMVCEKEAGKASQFRCWYHGWLYSNTGQLIGVPGDDAYGPEFRKDELGLSALPRVDSYRGFVFASASPDGIPLLEFLGGAAEAIDIVTDVSPIGQIAVDSGAHKTRFRGNWKHVGMDGYHPNVLHASVLTRFVSEGEGHFDNPWDDKAGSVTRHFGRGHTALDLKPHRMSHVDERMAHLQKLPGGADYVRDMLENHGQERGRFMIAMNGDPHVGFFPNLQLIGTQIRIVTPISVNETEITMMPMRILGVPNEINEARLRHHEMFYGPAGAGSPDDIEIFERVQRGMEGTLDPWINLQRGMNREQIDTDGTTIANISDELPQRAQFAAWLSYLEKGA